MTRALAMTAAVLAAGCVGAQKAHLKPLSDATISELNARPAQFVTAHLHDGTTFMGATRDFGDALCGPNGCVKKAEVKAIAWETTEDEFSPAMVLLSPLLAVSAPVMVPYALALWSDEQGKPQNAPLGEATAERLKRVWLDNLTLKDGMVYRWGDNPCVEAGYLPGGFAGDVEALAWLWEHRVDAPAQCLLSAASGFAFIGGDDSHERAMKLWALGAVRGAWVNARCLSNFVSLVPIVPDPILDFAPGRGDPQALAIVAETLAGEEAFRDVEELTVTCRAWPVAPESYWPTIKAEVREMGPFSRRKTATVTGNSTGLTKPVEPRS